MVLEYLTKLSEASLAVWLVALLIASIAFLLKPYTKYKITSFEPILLMFCVMTFLHIIWEVFLTSHFDNPDPGVREMVKIGWYVGYGTSDWLAVYLGIWISRKFKLERTYFSNSLLIIFAILGFIQLARYADLYYFGTDVLTFIYRNGIPTSTSVITIITLLNVSKKITLTRPLKREA